MSFFDSYPQFYSGNGNIRLNKRYKVFFEHWNNIWNDARVLDLGGCDGRWAFSAIKAGAKFVTVLEGVGEVCKRGQQTFSELNVPLEKFEFIETDFTTWQSNGREYDVVMCAGILSHVYNHPRVFSLMREVKANYVLVDAAINGYLGVVVTPLVNRIIEGNSIPSNDSFVPRDATELHMWTGHPSRDYIFKLADTFGFKLVDEYNWQKPYVNQIDFPTGDALGVEDYWQKHRISCLFKRK